MKNKYSFLIKIFLSPILIVNFTMLCVGQESAKFSTQDEIKEDISLVKCKNKERLEAVKNLFLKKGAKDNEIIIEDSKGVKNLVVTKKGKTDETIVIGAHYDEAGGGCGVIDNWSGIVIIANLYKILKDFTTRKTYKFVAFDKEEQGLIGSKVMVKAIPKENRKKYCSMVNFDSFGLTYPQAMRNISNKKLIDFAEKLAKEMKMPFATASIANASSDSEPFKNAKIPAISFHGLNGKWKEILHTHNDKIKNLNTVSVYYGYRFGLSFLAKMDANDCNAFRK